MTIGIRPALAFCILFLAVLGGPPPSSFAHCGLESFTPDPDAPLSHKHLFQPLLDAAPDGHFTPEQQQQLNTGIEGFCRQMDEDTLGAFAESAAHFLKMGFGHFPDFETVSQTLAFLYGLIMSEENNITTLAINFACTRTALSPAIQILPLDQKHQMLRRLATIFSLDPNHGAYADSVLVTVAPFFGPYTDEALFMDMVDRTLFYLQKTNGQTWSVYPFYVTALQEVKCDPQNDAATYIAALRNHVTEYHPNDPTFRPLITKGFNDADDENNHSSSAMTAEDEEDANGGLARRKKCKKKKKDKDRRPSYRKAFEKKKKKKGAPNET